MWAEDADGQVVGPGELGELWIKNSRGSPVYLNDPTKTSASVRQDGTYTIGDFGFFDEDGYLYIVDRRSDMIVSGGVNVYPAEIEAALTEHPDVLDAAAIGLDDTEWGKHVHAVVALKEGSQIQTAALDAFCRERLAGYKCPRSYEIVSAVPRDESGKLRRRLVQSVSATAQVQRNETAR